MTEDFYNIDDLKAAYNAQIKGLWPSFEIWYESRFKKPSKEPEWNGRCQCGHLHSEHMEYKGAINYTTGRCTIGECRCPHFINKREQ